LKIVNVGKEPVEMTVNLRGVGSVEPNGNAFVLSGDPKAVNTVDEPTKVVPKQETVTDASASFRRTFPPHSFMMLRLTTAPR
jgi:alpha-L-arabinofuranosidase